MEGKKIFNINIDKLIDSSIVITDDAEKNKKFIKEQSRQVNIKLLKLLNSLKIS